MYRIITLDGTELGMTDSVLYIKIGNSGSFTPCSVDEAIGVAFNSEPYNLIGHSVINGADTVIITKCDSGELIGAHDQSVGSLERENKLLREQVGALTEQNDFQEELIVELANVVYA